MCKKIVCPACNREMKLLSSRLRKIRCPFHDCSNKITLDQNQQIVTPEAKDEPK